MMNPTLVQMNNYSPTEDGIATATNGYFLPPNGWASVEPRVTYDSRVAMAALDVQKHSPPTNVSLLHARPRNLRCERRNPPHTVLPRQMFAHGPLAAAVSEQYHVPFTADQRYSVPATFEFSSYSNFNMDRDAHVSQGRSGNHATNYDFWTGIHSPSAVGSVSASGLSEQRPTMDGTPLANSIPLAWQRSLYSGGDPAASEGNFFVRKDANGVPSTHFEEATPAAHTFPPPDDPSSPFPPSGVGVQQSPSTIFAQHPSRGSPKPPRPSILQDGRAHHPAPQRGPLNPDSPNLRGALCSAERERSEERRATSAAAGQHEKFIRTLRSVRTRFGDVYAEHEQGVEQGAGGTGTGTGSNGAGGGRWVCQCGSTFVRDSDWERHAMHSLSHSAGGGFDCNLCDISFTRSDAMFRHRRKKHGIRNAPCRGPRESEDEGSQPIPRERQGTRFSVGKY